MNFLERKVIALKKKVELARAQPPVSFGRALLALFRIIIILPSVVPAIIRGNRARKAAERMDAENKKARAEQAPGRGPHH